MSRDDDGFTLVELLLAVAISAVLIPAATAAVVAFLRTSYTASVRADRAHDANLVASYLQPDLASVQKDPSTGLPALTLSGSACSNTLALTWSQQDYVPNGNGSAQAYVTTYSVVSNPGADGPYALTRSQTLNGSPSSPAIVVGHNLAAACDATFALNGSQVVLTMQQADSSGRAEASTIHVSGPTGVRS